MNKNENTLNAKYSLGKDIDKDVAKLEALIAQGYLHYTWETRVPASAGYQSYADEYFSKKYK